MAARPKHLALLERKPPCLYSGTAAHPLYVDHVRPSDGASEKLPVVMVPGAAHTGTCYLATPDLTQSLMALRARAQFLARLVDTAARDLDGISCLIAGVCEFMPTRGVDDTEFQAGGGTRRGECPDILDREDDLDL